MAGILSGALITAWCAGFGLLTGEVGWLLLGLAVGLCLSAVYGWAVAVAPVYDLRSSRGVVAFVVDHTWSLPNTLVGAVFLAVSVAFGNRLDRGFSGHIGLRSPAIPGYAGTTIGPVQAGTGTGVDRHEAVHVLQARLFGPLYLPLVGLNYAVATALPYWWFYHDHAARPIRGIRAYFTRGVYPHTWHEEWAYRVEGTPP
ncbi:hypothetical protein [Haloechinothrix salitolerans]|uniref:Uncharacterized protein n=1 Tax=Haloechinothrix salitolerans TaxID=926830 RepID=A0ABW2C1S9_9PSEU